MKMPKVKVPSTKDINKAINDTGKAVEKTANDAGKAVENTAKDVTNTVVQTTNTVVNDVTKAANESAKWISDTNARAQNIKAITDKVTADAKKAGIPVDKYINEFNIGTQLIQQAVTEGVEACEWVVQYLEQNACQIALSSALSLAFFTLLNPAQPEAEVAATPVSAAAIAYMAAGTAGKLALSQACYQFAVLISEPIYAIPEVKSALSKDGKHVLTMALGNSVFYGIQASAAAWTVPAAALMIMSAAFSTLIANLACTGTVPTGYKAMYGINDGYEKNFT